jgi:hypothetical protein
MRSQLTFDAMKHVPSRFLLAKLTAMATRRFHRPGTRVQETTNEVLERFTHANPLAEKRAAAKQSRAHRHAGKVPRAVPHNSLPVPIALAG